jgi:flagellar biosynthesis protein FlhA
MSDTQKVIRTALTSNPQDTATMAAVVAMVLMLVIPIPSVLLDLLLVVNLVISLFIIMIVLNTKKAIDFSIFPTMLLVTTVFGLALNVSSTRLILSKGTAFDGHMIRAFSRFVVGSADTTGLVIGLVIYVILIVVQAMVITKGASRTAEVAARFTLDGYPAKQMAIEAEYNSGAITEDEAKQRKRDLQKEIDFYGQMDGASKFVSGNVKVSIAISVIDLVAGIIIGMVLRKEQLGEAFSTYTILTIGDGLLSQIPALLVSVSTGIIVTRANADGTFGSEVSLQFAQNARIYWVTAVVLLILAVLPGFPWYVLIPMAALLGFLAFRLQGREMRKAEVAKAKAAGGTAEAKPKAQTELSPVVPLDPISLELGYGLIPLVDRDKGAELLERVTRIRKESALDMGLVVPHIRIIDNMRLEPSEYCFKIKGVEVGRGTLRMGSYLAINPGGVSEDIPGEKTKDPTFGLPALWITEEYREKSERSGFTVVDPPSIIATHLTEIIKRHAAEILGRQEVQAILDTLKKDYPAVVDEVNKGLALGEIQKVLQGLLREQVSIRNMVAILETLADYCSVTHDPGFLVEKSRQALARQICLQYSDQEKMLHVLTLNPALEQKIIDARVDGQQGAMAALEPGLQRKWIQSLSRAVSAAQERGFFPIVLVSEAARALVKSSSEREIPDLVVLSVLEVVSDMKVEVVGEIKVEA